MSAGLPTGGEQPTRDTPCVALASTVVRLRTAATTGRDLARRAAERHSAAGRMDVAAEFAAVWQALDVDPTRGTTRAVHALVIGPTRTAPTRRSGLRLTRGQQRVLAGFAAGHERAVVARTLGLSPHTVKNTLERIARANRLPAAGSDDLVAAFLRDGWDLGHPELPAGWWPTPSQARVLDAMLAGHVRNDQIAADLYVTVNTVKTVFTRLRTTLGGVSRAGLVAAWVHAQRAGGT